MYGEVYSIAFVCACVYVWFTRDNEGCLMQSKAKIKQHFVLPFFCVFLSMWNQKPSRKKNGYSYYAKIFIKLLRKVRLYFICFLPIFFMKRFYLSYLIFGFFSRNKWTSVYIRNVAIWNSGNKTRVKCCWSYFLIFFFSRFSRAQKRFF